MSDLKRELITDPDGTLHWKYTFDGPEGGGVIATGSAKGPVRLADGTVYDLTPDLIGHAPGHRDALLHHIEKWHERAGTFGPDFRTTHEDNTEPSE